MKSDSYTKKPHRQSRQVYFVFVPVFISQPRGQLESADCVSPRAHSQPFLGMEGFLFFCYHFVFWGFATRNRSYWWHVLYLKSWEWHYFLTQRHSSPCKDVLFYKQDIWNSKGTGARKGDADFCSLKYLKCRQVSLRRNSKELVWFIYLFIFIIISKENWPMLRLLKYFLSKSAASPLECLTDNSGDVNRSIYSNLCLDRKDGHQCVCDRIWVPTLQPGRAGRLHLQAPWLVLFVDSYCFSHLSAVEFLHVFFLNFPFL